MTLSIKKAGIPSGAENFERLPSSARVDLPVLQALNHSLPGCSTGSGFNQTRIPAELSRTARCHSFAGGSVK